MKTLTHFFIVLLIFLSAPANSALAESGGPLKPLQAAFDVNYYELDLTIDHVTQSIAGSLLCRVEIVDPIDTLLLDLDDPFTIDSVLFRKNGGSFSITTFSHSGGLVYVDIPENVVAEDLIFVQIFYHGSPRIAPNPPWVGGFVWEETSTGDPWIGVACEFEGADIWWPCKDHPSDEPDSMHMSFTVQDPLMCVSNGQYLGSVPNANGTTTFNWFISTPINNYNVSIYAADFMLIEDNYMSTIGDSIPFRFWVLPEDYNTAVDHMDVFQAEFDFLESICGPFPFGTDKHGWAHAPYWGMEHQTIIAYGHDFTTNYWGFDYIHYHELAHEWWGNLITAKDWSDVWIHEGMATYTEALYVEYLSGMDKYHQYMDQKRPANTHQNPLAPYDSLTTNEGFSLNPYNRGASVMHTFRWHLGDSLFFELFERWAYPDSSDYDNTNGRQCRILSTEDMKNQAEEVTGLELDPFWDVFFREAAYPVLHVVKGYAETEFTWETENNVLLDVDVPIRVNGVDMVVEMTDGVGAAAASYEDELLIDPKKWILMAVPSIITSVEAKISGRTECQLYQNFPNPFKHSTSIKFFLPASEYVSLKVFDVYGNEIAELVNEELSSGSHEILFDGSGLPNGTYFYRLHAGDYSDTKNIVRISE
ncbi:MAG: M1 family aminopeptidase [Bacteroidota bacterium]|nr:M1 family aminopeptidase [Bacteroidota bacterium]